MADPAAAGLLAAANDEIARLRRAVNQLQTELRGNERLLERAIFERQKSDQRRLGAELQLTDANLALSSERLAKHALEDELRALKARFVVEINAKEATNDPALPRSA